MDKHEKKFIVTKKKKTISLTEGKLMDIGSIIFN